jgi:shikimate dehydrogenase
MTVYAEVIGDPIAHSRSPMIHGFWLEKCGIEADYRACHVTATGLPAYLAARRQDTDWRGCNVTIPHKLAALALADRVDPVAARIGASNCLLPQGDGTLLATNTDAAGFLEPLHGRRFATACVIGAGGAARAVLSALADRGLGWISLRNRSVDKAAALLAEFAVAGEALALDAAGEPADLLVNTSSLGMGQAELPTALLDIPSLVREGGTVYDIVYAPLETRLLAAAGAQGRVCIDGLAMLIGQAAVAFEHFFGVAAPRRHDDELRARLTA